jgi:hypothetical protein
MKPVVTLLAALTLARVAAGQTADDYRGGWRTDSGEAHTYEFSIRSGTVRGVCCTYCADATTLAFIDGTFGPDGIRFEVIHVNAVGSTTYKDEAIATFSFRIEGDTLKFNILHEDWGDGENPTFEKHVTARVGWNEMRCTTAADHQLPPPAPRPGAVPGFSLVGPIPVEATAVVVTPFGEPAMRVIAFGAACMVCWASVLQAADLVSGTWTAGEGPATRIYVFKVSGDRLTGIMCGPCDDPASVFRIEDGRIVGEDRATFFIRYDVGGPAFRRYGPYRERVDASIARNAMRLSAQPETDSGAATSSISLTRVVENFELSPQPLPAAPTGSVKPSAASRVEGRWVSVGRTAQQNWILKVQGDEVWGLVCGPCTPAVVTMIDGRIDGDTITFNINHIDTPPNANRRGIQRNIMTGTISGSDNANVMRFTWVGEGSANAGEITMIGPIR